MKVYNLIENFKNLPLAIALGYFDGVHIGHRKVISETIKLKSEGLIPSLFTFNKSPRSLLYGTNERILLDNDTKEKIFNILGIELLYMINFEDIYQLSSDEFIKNVLKKSLNVKHVVCGFNYHFGNGGKSNAEELKKLCLKYGIKTTIINPVLYKFKPVSSTRIRKSIENNDTESIDEMLKK